LPRADETQSSDNRSERLWLRARILTWLRLAIGVAAIVGLIALIDWLINSDPTLDNAEPSTSAERIVFEDDFANRANGWDDAGSTRAGGHYKNGAYRIYAAAGPSGEQYIQSSTPRKVSRLYPSAPASLVIEVEAKALALPTGTAYGFGCRVGKNRNGPSGYVFAIGADYYNIGKYGVDGTYRELDSGGLPSTFKVKGTNRLEAECSDDDGEVYLVFSLNGDAVGEAFDSQDPLTSGTVALFAVAGEKSEEAVEVEFDNFVVQA
jgi:hypothetical protein